MGDAPTVPANMRMRRRQESRAKRSPPGTVGGSRTEPSFRPMSRNVSVMPGRHTTPLQPSALAPTTPSAVRGSRDRTPKVPVDRGRRGPARCPSALFAAGPHEEHRQ
ncbi:hypothetical protein ASR50_03080 [Streptomyces sp. 4F]|nr:hypothetical protein ASR50_03080 [Streptomyces sp. 4F]